MNNISRPLKASLTNINMDVKVQQLYNCLQVFKQEYSQFVTFDEQTQFLENHHKNLNLLELGQIFKQLDHTCLPSFAVSDLSLDDYLKTIDFHNAKVPREDVFHDIPHYIARNFFLAKGKKIKIHDHPNMLIFSKVFHGEVSINNYQKKNPNAEYEEKFEVVNTGVAKLKKITDVGILTPHSNNFHEITANEDSFFFDIMLPYYDPLSISRCKKYYEVIQEKEKTYLQKI